MEIPKGFRQITTNSNGTVLIKNQEGNEYLLVPGDGENEGFWISAHEISKHIHSKTHMIAPASISTDNPWVFVDLNAARDAARKEGGRLPTESEYERYYKLCKRYHLAKEQYFLWTETKEGKNYIARKGKEREVCYATRQTNHLSFRIVLEA